MADDLERRVIVWRVTQECNLGCGFCSYSNRLVRLRSDAEPGRVGRFGNVLGKYAKQTGRRILVSWIGGEPLLWPALFDVSTTFVREYGLDVSMTTNGLLLRSRRNVERVVDDFAEIVISLDGMAHFNDRVRQRPGLFESVKKSICDLVDLRISKAKPLVVKVNTILMRDNIEQFEKLCEQLQSWGVQELTFNQLGGYDRPEFFPANRLQTSQVHAFTQSLDGWKASFAKKGLIIRGSSDYLHRFDCSSRDRKIPVEDCAPGAWFWFINEKGGISPCSYTSYEYAVDIDSIGQPDRIDRIESDFRSMRAERRSRFCEDCHCTQQYAKFS